MYQQQTRKTDNKHQFPPFPNDNDINIECQRNASVKQCHENISTVESIVIGYEKIDFAMLCFSPTRTIN